MRYAIIATILGSLLAASQAVAHGGGGGGGGHAGGGFHGAVGVHVGHANAFVRHPNNVTRAFRQFQHNRFSNSHRFNNNGNQFVGGFGWPVADWWPDTGYAYPPVQQVQEPPVQPQVIVIHADGDGHMQTAETAPDVSYVKGCHAIPNGYHCDPP